MSGNKSIKEENKKSVIIFILFFAAIPFIESIFNIYQNQDDSIYKFLIAAVEILITYSIGYFLIDIVNPTLRDSLISLNFKNPLQASRYIKLCKKDKRIHKNQVEKLSKNSGNDQNSYWYNAIYTPSKNEKIVHEAHKDYLKYRDIFSGLLFITLISIVILILDYTIPSLKWIALISQTTSFDSLNQLAIFYFCATILIGYISNKKAKRFVCNACIARFTINKN
ncbi:MAG: hypothetical protein RPR97_00035 [Colwellia sp.]